VLRPAPPRPAMSIQITLGSTNVVTDENDNLVQTLDHLPRLVVPDNLKRPRDTRSGKPRFCRDQCFRTDTKQRGLRRRSL
jgi:hypothetical protein